MLFIESLWLDQKEEFGIINAEHNLWNTWKQYAGEDKFQRFSFDEYFKRNNAPGDKACLELVESWKPDIILLDWHIGSKLNPTPETLREIHNKKKTPVVAVWWDHLWKAHITIGDMLQYWIDLNVVVDTSAFFNQVNEPNKFLFLWTPQDKNLYHYCEDKYVESGFYGRLKKCERENIILKVHEAIPEFNFAGGRREKPFARDEYAKAYRHTAMVVNFSSSQSGMPQLVGRTLEATLSNCLLLEEANPETRGMFKVDEEFVEWKTADELIEKIKYYTQHWEERKKIAKAGCDRATKYYNSNIWWDTVVRAVA